MRRTAIYAGSFDPPTLGHEWMIQRGIDLFDEFYVAIGTNPSKTCRFDINQRIGWLRKIGGHSISVRAFENQYLVKYAAFTGANFILRGIRNPTDFVYEQGMRHINEDLHPLIQTIFLVPPRHLTEISSSFVKGLIGPKGWRDVVAKYLPLCVFKDICNGYD